MFLYKVELKVYEIYVAYIIPYTVLMNFVKVLSEKAPETSSATEVLLQGFMLL